MGTRLEKCKLFVGGTSDLKTLEDVVNNWLTENSSVVEITERHTSVTSTTYGITIVITFFYKEKEVPFQSPPIDNDPR